MKVVTPVLPFGDLPWRLFKSSFSLGRCGMVTYLLESVFSDDRLIIGVICKVSQGHTGNQRKSKRRRGERGSICAILRLCQRIDMKVNGLASKWTSGKGRWTNSNLV